jgi:hypothetical protein
MPMIDGPRYDPTSLSKDCSIINVQLIEIPLAPGIFWMDGRQPEAIHKRGSRTSVECPKSRLALTGQIKC